MAFLWLIENLQQGVTGSKQDHIIHKQGISHNQLLQNNLNNIKKKDVSGKAPHPPTPKTD